jgi:hypothetical protein
MGIAPDERHNSSAKCPVITALVLTFFPLQPRRKLSLPGGSAAKVFEPRSQKTKSKTARRGEFFAARPVGSVFGNSGMSGSPSFGYFSWRDKKSD